jgi:Reverse transcriptase (RNA-dependent DNA polymerase)
MPTISSIAFCDCTVLPILTVILSLCSTFGFKLWTQEISQAYLQSDKNLRRDVIVCPSAEFDLPRNKVLRLLRPMYCLSDAGDYWNETISDHQANVLGMNPTYGDVCLYIKVRDGKLIGLSGVYIDDLVQAGNKDFETSPMSWLEYLMPTRTYLAVSNFCGGQISVNDSTDGFLSLGHPDHVSNLSCLSLNCTTK